MTVNVIRNDSIQMITEQQIHDANTGIKSLFTFYGLELLEFGFVHLEKQICSQIPKHQYFPLSHHGILDPISTKRQPFKCLQNLNHSG